MNTLVVLLALLGFVAAQRPSYAGSGPIGYPGLASRFRETEPSTISPFDLNNRLGEESTTLRLPVDARGDAALVNRLNQWPRENRPFWILNAEQIEAHRNPQGFNWGQVNAQTNPTNFQSRSSIDEFGEPVPSIPIRPSEPRSSFLSSRP